MIFCVWISANLRKGDYIFTLWLLSVKYFRVFTYTCYVRTQFSEFCLKISLHWCTLHENVFLLTTSSPLILLQEMLFCNYAKILEVHIWISKKNLKEISVLTLLRFFRRKVRTNNNEGYFKRYAITRKTAFWTSHWIIEQR